MSSAHLRPIIACMALAIAAAVSTRRGVAQATPVERSPASLQVFGTYSAAFPDYQPNGYSAVNETGFTLGGDYQLSRFHVFDPGLEVRASTSTGSELRLRTLLPGPRLQANLGRWKPYIDFLIGVGDIRFQHPVIPGYIQNNSVVYSPGLGIDYNLSRHFAARVDFQEQFWKISVQPLVAFHPAWVSAGVVYRFSLGRSQ